MPASSNPATRSAAMYCTCSMMQRYSRVSVVLWTKLKTFSTEKCWLLVYISISFALMKLCTFGVCSPAHHVGTSRSLYFNDPFSVQSFFNQQHSVDVALVNQHIPDLQVCYVHHVQHSGMACLGLLQVDTTSLRQMCNIYVYLYTYMYNVYTGSHLTQLHVQIQCTCTCIMNS